MLGISGIGTGAICINPPVTPTPLMRAAQATAGQVFLVIIEPYNLDPDVNAIEPFYFSDVGYKTPSKGSRADIWFEGRATSPLDLSWNIPVVPEADRRVMLDVGNIELANADGQLDALIDSYDIGGRNITVLFGLDSFAFDEFTVIWKGAGVSWSRDFAKINISCRDVGYQADAPFQAEYEGGGDSGGTDDLKGKPKPAALGYTANIEPVLIDPVYLIYQVNNGPVSAIDQVYDRGVPLGDGPEIDYSDYYSLKNTGLTPITPGRFATSLESGIFRLGAAPSGQITCDVHGEKVSGFSADENSDGNIGRISQRVLSAHALPLDQPRIDAFCRLPAFAYPAGYYTGSDQQMTIADMMNDLMASCAGWWGTTLDGKFTVGRLELPTEGDVVLDLQKWDILDVEILDPAEGTMPPRWRQQITGNRNWTAQSATDLAASGIGSAHYSFALTANTIIGWWNGGGAAIYASAQESPIINSFMYTGGDSYQQEARRIIDLLGAISQTIRITMDLNGLMITRGACLALTEPRINGGERWIGRIIGAELDAANRQVDLIVWGPMLPAPNTGVGGP